jgi:hypothetical protein
MPRLVSRPKIPKPFTHPSSQGHVPTLQAQTALAQGLQLVARKRDGHRRNPPTHLSSTFDRSMLPTVLVSQGVISRNYDDSQYDGLILDLFRRKN